MPYRPQLYGIYGGHVFAKKGGQNYFQISGAPQDSKLSHPSTFRRFDLLSRSPTEYLELSGDPNPKYFWKSIAIQVKGALQYKWEAYHIIS